jgi:TolB-like protein
MAAGRLTLRLLGEIEMERGGERLTLPASKKTRALLAYLALSARPQRRERLCQMFWDVPDDPRGALRWSLSKLRGLVDEPDRARVVAERDSVALDAADIDIDLAEARRRLAGGEAALSPAALGEIAGLFRGEFLEGLELANCPEFQAWRAAQREEARVLHRRVLASLVERLAASPAEALPHAAALAAIEPYAAWSHLALLRLLAGAGRMREAERQFEASHRLLAEASAASARELEAEWRALRRAGPAAAPAQPAAAPAMAPAIAPDGERPTVAVLPFANVGGSAGDDYFSQGISDEIAAELARFADLTILAPSTTVRVKDNPAPVPEIAGKLRANYLLDGVVTRADQRMRMTARLLDGASGASLWAERFDRQLGDIFEVQDEITRTVAASLSIRLRDTGAKRSLRKRTRDLTAYDLMLRARRYVSVLSPEEHARARDCLEEAVRRDPGYADAHAALVYVYGAEYSHGHNPRPEPLQRAMASGRRALELDPQNPRAHASLALIHFFRRDDAIFASEAERALALNPNDPEMAGMLGAYFVYTGAYERGLALLNESMRLNPLHPTWYHYSFVIRHVVRGEIDEALARLALVDIQEFHWTLVLRAALLGLKGAAADAGATYRRFRARYPDFDVGDYLGRWIRSADYIERILAGLATAERAAAAGDGA